MQVQLKKIAEKDSFSDGLLLQIVRFFRTGLTVTLTGFQTLY